MVGRSNLVKGMFIKFIFIVFSAGVEWSGREGESLKQSYLQAASDILHEK